MTTIDINKQIPQENWLEFFDTFTDGNRGRHIKIELLDPELGDEELIKDAPLFSINYDPVDKGNDIMIETGGEAPTYAHTIDVPTEVWTGQDANGVVLALRITSKDTQAIITFQP